MFFIWKGKGFLIIPYLFLTNAVVAALFGIFNKPINKIFINGVSIFLVLGIAIILTGLFTSLTAIDYIKVNDKKQIYDDDHSLFFIKMKYWKYIFYILGISFLIFGIFDSIFIITEGIL